MKKIIVLLICCFILTGCIGTVKKHNSEKGTIKTITCEEKDNLLKEGAVLVDVRNEDEYEEYHLDNSVNVPLSRISEITNYITSLPKDGNIIVYCKTGKRSTEAANKLINMGYKYIYNLGAITNCQK